MSDQRTPKSRFYDPLPPLRKRVITWVAFVVGGLAVTSAFAALVHPSYPDVCQRFTSAAFPCDPVPFSSFIAYSVMVVGMAVWIIGPIVWALLGLRKGYKWEQSRVEPAEINLIILIGFIYMGIGVAILVLR
ncbi:MAG: hypothetical protein KJN71_10390 [Acidimicrobiia bacterium]|nr:hypothetical protein [Acidimicrobiia bacterium]NNC76092.1 hypothetical protein [Acidimicrobiia bacterium]